MTTQLNHPVTHDNLIEFFKNWIGPVFCTPSRLLLNLYPKMMGMVGIILPLTNPQFKLIKIDWSLDKNWPEASELYKPLKHTQYTLDQLHIIRPGTDVPKIAEDNYINWNWQEFKTGDLVCISMAKLTLHEFSARRYANISSSIGIINDKCDQTNDTSIMVGFRNGSHIKIMNVEKRILVKLPETFRPDGDKPQSMIPISHTPYKTKAKYKVGQVIKVSSSVVNETFMGLLGVIKSIEDGLDDENDYSITNKYVVDLNVLPNRNLALTIGEKVIPGEIKLEQYNIDEWDERISEHPYFLCFRKKNFRHVVWVPEEKCMAEIDTKSNCKKSVGEGIKIEATLLNKETNQPIGEKRHISCRDIDYRWDKASLGEVLKSQKLCIGIEEDKRNPNEISTKIYIYVFDGEDNIGKLVNIRILLGTLQRRKSVIRKFAKTLMTQKFTHPWQIKRYLRENSLGYIYEIFSADSWLRDIGKFTYAR